MRLIERRSEMATEAETRAALDGLAALIERARSEGKWLHCPYQDLWFSPDELADQNDRGSFRWGPVNWTLRDPIERLEQLEAAAASARRARDAFSQRISSPVGA
jgi:hypothetical protein